MKKLTVLALSILTIGNIFAQNQSERADQVQLNSITTAVPFLLITPDSRAGAMGDAGVALSPDVNAIHWGAAKMAFLEEDAAVGISYSPWLRSIVPDMNLAYLSGVKKINANSAAGASLRYFNLGAITFTDENGDFVREFKPSEFSLDVAYALKASKQLSFGVALRYIQSNLTGGSIIAGAETQAGRSVAFDFSTFYQSKRFRISDKEAYLNFGLNISNVGNKMNYTTTTEPDFIPANLKLGPALQINLDDYNTFTVSLEANKLLVPTPPVYQTDESGNIVIDPATDEPIIVEGKDPDVSPVSGVLQSFGDAPGGGSEELSEFNLGVGFEYLYNQQIAVRGGFFNEPKTKGNRKYISMGAGFKYNVMNVDLSYLISVTQNNPLANTLRLSLRFGFGKGADVTPDEEEQQIKP